MRNANITNEFGARQVRDVEVLIFTRGAQVASLVTDGTTTAVYMETGRTLHRTMQRAVASLEARGYSIDIEASSTTWKR